jgi:hypothetical protein
MVMACTVTETVRGVQSLAIEPLLIDPTHSSYPYPPLALGLGLETHDVPILTLENAVLCVSCAPTLGSRIVELVDKRSGLATITLPKSLPLEMGGSRGVRSPFGIQLTLDGSERLTSLGHVDWTSDTDEEDGSASITFAESGSWPFSYHLSLSIEEESTEILVRAKVFNRSLQPAHYNAGLLFGDAARPLQTEAGWLFRSDVGSSYLVSSPDLVYSHGSLCRFGGRRTMGPRQLDEWSATLRPVMSASEFARFGSSISVHCLNAQVEIETSRDVGAIKLVVQSATGETLEANLTPSLQSALRVPLREQDLPLLGVAVLDGSRNVLIPPGPILAAPAASSVEELPDEPLYTVPSLNSSDSELKSAAFDVRLRSLSHLLLATKAMAVQNWNEASFRLEQTLLFNGEDQLAWWLKARCERMAVADADVGQEALNAQYLAPLEPMLRIEALLSQAFGDSQEANPVLQAYAEDREAMVETCAELIQAGLFLDAMRLISEWMRFQDFPMLRYLLAFCYLKASRMSIEAAEQLRVASMMAASAPYPVRPMELEALRDLAMQWPDEPQLRLYLDLAERRPPAI